MPRTKIDWCDYSINPVKGLCPVACSYCYARQLYKRFKWNPEIRFEPKVFTELSKIKGGSRVFIGSTIELFGEWVKEDWLETIFRYVKMYPKITFLFLTKCPWNLKRWNPWPDNAWVGASAWDFRSTAHALYASGGLEKTEAKVKFISFEPLLSETKIDFRDFQWAGISWVIIGAATGRGAKPLQREWITEIIEACQRAGIPYFLKDNLKPLLGENLMQEFPG